MGGLAPIEARVSLKQRNSALGQSKLSAVQNDVGVPLDDICRHWCESMLCLLAERHHHEIVMGEETKLGCCFVTPMFTKMREAIAGIVNEVEEV